MKKTLLLALIAFTINAKAQQTFKGHPIKIENANAHKAAQFNQSNQRSTMASGYLDYSWADYNDNSYVFGFNSTFTSIDSTQNYIGVALYPFTGFFDYTDNTTDFDITPYPTNFTYTVDSIFALITQENNSGQYDKLTMQLVQLNSTNALSAATNTAVWSQTDSTNTGWSTGNNWLGTGVQVKMTYEPGYTTTPGQKLGMVLKYNAPKMDSLGVIGSYLEDTSIPGSTTTQAQYPTSFVRIPPFIPNIIPNRGITYTGTNPVEYYSAQDWEIWAFVTFNDLTGISDNELNKNVTLYQNSPNPANNGMTTIKYDLTKSAEVSLTIADVTGRKVIEQTEGSQTAGKHQSTVDISNLSKGVYFYTLTANDKSLTKKMVITK